MNFFFLTVWKVKEGALFLVTKPSKNSFNLNKARIKNGDSFFIDTWWNAQNVSNGITECAKVYRKRFLLMQ